MAETLAAVGVASSIVQLVDFSVKVVNRVNDFVIYVNEAPELFRDILLQLPLLIETLRRTQYHVDHGHYPPHTEAALRMLVDGCRSQIALLEDLLDKVAPKQQDSKMKRSRRAISSLKHDKTILNINLRLSRYVEKLILFQSTIAPDYIINSMRQTLSLVPRCHQGHEAALGADASSVIREVQSTGLEGPVQRGRKYHAIYNNQNRYRISTFVSLVPLDILWAFQASLDLSWGSRGYSVALTLRLQRMVKYTSPGFKILWLCEESYIDLSTALKELNLLFQMGKASPLDVNPAGNSLLETLLMSQLITNVGCY